ncbi:MAG: TPM domain-containing protein [Candidatus Omnitrophota bacterium]
MKKTAAVLAVVVLCLCGAAISSAREAVFPSKGGFITDNARILSEKTKTELTSLISEVEEKTGAEIAVVTVKTTEPLTIEQYAVELFAKWGIGKKGKDNGVLILVASLDRNIRIETGYGLEGVLTDLESKIIIQKLMVPAFRQGNYDLGVASGVVMVAKLLRDEYGVTLNLDSKKYPLQKESRFGSAAGFIITLLFLFLIFGTRYGWLFLLMGSGSSGGGYWSGSSGGGSFGGFGGFGGGMSGGGGASGSW